MKNEQKTTSEKVILGIDPGTNVMGYGLINVQKQHIKLIALGVIELTKYGDHYRKLQKIFERTVHLVDEYKPDEMALEAPFYGKNVQSMLKLGRAQGVAMAAGLHRSVPIFEYSPRKIKIAICGNGNASKEQIASFLVSMLNLNEIPAKLDATDGLAVAVCHHFQSKAVVSNNTGTYKNWKDFVNKNTDRISD